MYDRTCGVCGKDEDDHALSGLFDGGESGPTVAGTYTDPNTFTICVQAEIKRLQDKVDAARSILWMAQAYAEGGGSGGPEMQDYEAAAAIIEED